MTMRGAHSILTPVTARKFSQKPRDNAEREHCAAMFQHDPHQIDFQQRIRSYQRFFHICSTFATQQHEERIAEKMQGSLS